MKLQRKCMGKEMIILIVVLLINIFCVGCDKIGSKTMNLSIIYGFITIIALVLMVSYVVLVNKKELWFLLLFSSVLIVNLGYFALSLSKNLQEALLANRIAYLGSVFLPMSMFIIILNVCEIQYKSLLPGILLLLSVFVFLVAASPGYLNIYYKEVEFVLRDGVGMLDKTYGSWHSMYLFYLVIYFSMMVAVILYASVAKKAKTKLYAIILAGAVLVNIGVWLLEQLVYIEFEFLSVSYVISEFFMLSLCLIKQEQGVREGQTVIDTKSGNEYTTENVQQTEHVLNAQTSDESIKATYLPETELQGEITEQDEQIQLFLEGVANLTPTENKIYEFYLDNKSTKEILVAMNITENTLKYHNKNIYGKLGVSSRKQLKEIAKGIV